MKVEILVIGKNNEILQVVIRLVNNNPQWNAVGATTAEEAIEKFHHQHFDMVMLTNGIEEEEEKKLRKLFTHQNKDIIIIQHYGGGSGLLSNEILQALDKRKEQNKPAWTIHDDVFKKH